MTAKRGKIGQIVIKGYVVDMNNEDHVEHAMEAFLDDIYQAAVKATDLSELQAMIEIVEDKKLKKTDIPDFLDEGLGY